MPNTISGEKLQSLQSESYRQPLSQYDSRQHLQNGGALTSTQTTHSAHASTRLDCPGGDCRAGRYIYQQSHSPIYYPSGGVSVPYMPKGGSNAFGNRVEKGANIAIVLLPNHRGFDLPYRYGDVFLNHAKLGANIPLAYIRSRPIQGESQWGALLKPLIEIVFNKLLSKYIG